MKVRVFTWRFFLENAGYCTPPGRAMCALNEGIEFRLEDDLDADDSFVETWPARDQKAWKQQSHSCYSVICYRPCPEHGWDCKHKEVLASLGGIFDPTGFRVQSARVQNGIVTRSPTLTL